MTTFDDGVAKATTSDDHAGSMTLREHLRELRSRLLKSSIAIVLGAVVAWFFYEQIFAFISDPVMEVLDKAAAQGRDVQVVVLGVTDPFTLKLKISAAAGLLLAAPVWLYQLWRFITPGLHRHERRSAYAFVALSLPLFLAGVVTAYLVLPKGLELLFNFTPENVGNFVEVNRYLSFFIRLALVFGIGFLLPVVLVALNMVGLLSGARLISWWRGIIFGVFLFAAVATPTGDPVTLFVLALPMLALVGAAIGFALLNDKRRARNSSEPDYGAWGDDESSPLAGPD